MSTNPELLEFQEYARRWLAENAPVIRYAIMQRAIAADGLRQNGRRARVAARNDHPLRLALQQKLLASELVQHDARLGVSIAGARGTLYKLDPNAPDGGRWPLTYMNSYGHTIAARMAKSAASDAGAFLSDRSVQLHGGIGFTWECDVHIFFKRSLHDQALLGDGSEQRRGLAELLIGPIGSSSVG